VDNDQAAGGPALSQVSGARRKFLRQAGMGGAATAALLGLTEVAGLPSARATAKSSARDPRPAKSKTVHHTGTHATGPAVDTPCGTMSLFCSPGNCGAACPHGSWCFLFAGCSSAGNMCMPGSCRTYYKPCCA
jgi:hypothetical protein